jgi:hypothetical protein
VPPDLRCLPKEIESALFRVVQESLIIFIAIRTIPTARVRLKRDSSAIDA